MNIKYKDLFLVTFFSCLTSFIFGQKEIILNSPDAGNKTYVAKETIRLMPNYSYKGVTGQQMRAYIDPSISVPLTPQPTFSMADLSRSINTALPVGAVLGSASVTQSGSASYAIPIQLPSGTNGMQPSIAVSYNSLAGNGLLGMGWSISGLSAITRVPSKNYLDYDNIPVNFNIKDRYALDGNRLIDNYSGSYGMDGTIYGTEQESFSKITSWGSTAGAGPLYFIVETKDGKKIEYGKNSDATLTQEGGSAILCWMINKITDLNGNYIVFKYKNDSREIRIDKILFTGTQSQLPYNTIQFCYDTRNDNNTTYVGGSSVNANYLLTKIIVTADGQHFKDYSFSYGQNQYSLLKEVMEQGAGWEKLNTTIFKYGDVPVDFQTSTTSSFVGVSADIISSRDFNGDGKSDILLNRYSYINNYKVYTGWEAMVSVGNDQFTHFASGTIPSGYTIYNPDIKPILSGMNRMLDFNGDGNEDILFVRVQLNNGAQELTNLKVVTINGYNNTSTLDIFSGSAFVKIDKSLYTGDFDGDGQDDVLLISRPTTTGDYSAKKFSSSTVGPGYYYNTVAVPGMKNLPFAESVYPVDFNGNGKLDLMAVYSSSVPGFTYCQIFELIFYQDTYIDSKIYESRNPGFPTHWHTIFTGDFNGDGKTDLLTTGDNTNWSISLSTGTTFVSTPFSMNYYYDASSDKLIIADCNGDGKSDIIHGYNVFQNGVASSSKFDVFYSVGKYFNYYSYSFGSLLGGLPFISGDFNGDGKTDLINRTYYMDPANMFYFNKDGKNLLLEKVLDGFNNLTTYNYTWLTKGVNYTRSSPIGGFPVSPFNSPIPIVIGMSNPDGIGGYNNLEYQYQDAKIHKSGRGFLGFSKVISKDFTSNIQTTREYEINSKWYVSLLKSQKTNFISNNFLVSEVINTNYIFKPATSRYWPYVAKIQSTNYLNASSATTDNTYDYLYGNVTSSSVNNGVETTTMENVIEQHGTWIPSSLSSQTVTKLRTGQSSYIRTTSYVYNGLNQVTQKITDPGTSGSVTTSFTYDGFGNNISAQTTATGVQAITTSSVFEPKGRFIIKSINPLGQTSETAYDTRFGKPVSIKGIDGLISTFSYDGFGKPVSSTDPLGVVIKKTYNWEITSGGSSSSAANYTTFSINTTHPGQPDVKEWFDALSRSVQTEKEGFSQTIRTVKKYDQRGNLTSETMPFFVTNAPGAIVTFGYDAVNNRLVSSSSAAGITTSYKYTTSAGLLTMTTTKPDGQASSTVIDASGKTISATDNGGTLQYDYFSSGKEKAIRLGNVEVAAMTYDLYGSKTQLIDKNGGTTSYQYDAYGQIISQTDANLATYQMSYDKAGRVISKTGPDGVISYEYNTTLSGLNQLKKITGANGVYQEFTYDTYNRNITTKEVVGAEQFITSRMFDKYNNEVSHTYPSGLVINYQYNNNSYLTSVTSSTGTVLFSNPVMNANEQYAAYTMGNGITTTKFYDTYGFPSRIRTSTGIQDLELNINPQNGNLKYRLDYAKGLKETFTYDNLNRLTNSVVHDINTNVQLPPVSTAYAFASDGVTSNGNIANKSDAGTEFIYEDNRTNALSFVKNNTANIGSVQQNITYTNFRKAASIIEGINELYFTYGPDYNRVKTETKNSGTLVKTKYFASEYEKEVEGAVTREIHYIPCGDAMVWYVKINGTGSYYYTYRDHLGSILGVTNSSGGLVAEQNFDAWGRYRNPQNWTYQNTPTTNPVWLQRGYTGHEHLAQFGLINMNNRMYDPVVGRMLATDNYVQSPFLTQSYNRYSYCLNNPLKFTDPTGDFFWFMFAGAAIGSYVGKSMQTDNWKPFDLKSWEDGLQGAVIGGIAGASIGAGFEPVANKLKWYNNGAVLMNNQRNVATLGWKVFSDALMTADINMLSTWAQHPHDWEMIAKDGLVGFGSGFIGGLVGNIFDVRNTSNSADNPALEYGQTHSPLVASNQPQRRTFFPIQSTKMTNIITTTFNSFGRELVRSSRNGNKNAASYMNIFVIGGLNALVSMLPGSLSNNMNDLGRKNIEGHYLSVGLSQVLLNWNPILQVDYK